MVRLVLVFSFLAWCVLGAHIVNTEVRKQP